MKRMRKFGLFLVGFYVLWAIRVVAFSPVLEGIQSEWGAQAAGDGVRVLVWILPVMIYLRFVEQVSALSYLRMDTMGKQWGLWLAVGIGFVAVVFGGQAMMPGTARVVWPENGAAWALMVFRLPMAPLAEEMFFRGFVQRQVSGRFPFWKANLLTALLFTGAHWVGWVYFFGWGTLPALSFGVFAIGWVLGWIAHKTESIWPGVIVHIVNNFVSWVVLFG